MNRGLQTDTIRLDSSSFKGREGASAAAQISAFFCINVHLQRKGEEELATVCHGHAGFPLGFVLYMCLKNLKEEKDIYVWVNKPFLRLFSEEIIVYGNAVCDI